MNYQSYSLKKNYLLYTAMLLSLISPGITYATSENGNKISKNHRNNAITEELVVYGKQEGYYADHSSTALKQDLSLLETPQSVFIINDALIADQQAFRLDQILQNDSSVQKANSFLGAYSSYQIRGFQLNNGRNYLRDGRTSNHLSAPPTEILQQVEVVKGPSSILYGTLSPGGLINLVPKRSLSETAGFIKFTGGSNNFNHLHADLSGPLNADSSVRYRLNYVTEDSESFRQFFSGEEFTIDRTTYAAALEWDISEQTSLSINYDNTNDERPQDNGLTGVDGVFDIFPYDLIYNQPWTHYNSEASNVLTEINHQFSDNWGIKLGYSFQDFERDRYDNQLRDFDPLTGDSVLRARRRSFQADYTTYYADLSGKFYTGSILHNILFGFDQTDIDEDFRENPNRVTFTSNIFEASAPNPLIPLTGPISNTKQKSQGFYVQDMLELNEQWRLLLGVRYDDYEAESASNGYTIDNVTPRLGLLYFPRPDFSIYASYSESFEPNGPVGGGFVNAGQEQDPTLGKGIELGTKWEGFNGNLLLTGAVFSIERSDEPFENIIDNRLEQRGLQRHNGMELSASGIIGDNLSVVVSATYLDAKFKVNDDPALVDNTPFGVAETAFSLWAEYQFSQDLIPGLSVNGGLFYESDRPVDDRNSFDLDAYQRVDIGLKYDFDISNQNFITRLTISNLFDEKYFKARNRSAINPERLREIRGSIQYNF